MGKNNKALGKSHGKGGDNVRARPPVDNKNV